MYKEDLTLNNPTIADMPQNPTKPNHTYLIYMCKKDFVLNNPTMVEMP